ncbi:ROK family transcriptional regulator [Amycolatopsis regifaucium]|uniref:ROK family transcriptional regulator n=1 Tax=Amycolatopsis regifaucium TaxID=546365 RepID=A0A154MQ38_9PSEU|nr:ROK family transcriptional regulator [Amycolatopsis regifaucium]KZB86053.1 ROK family transcriptional regulator [Amycolatopsis regifaucium]OKA04945.1 sugar kinase [Amycolatopsis regifaucium]SFH76145.1 Sugar kinase of the NBD/HSP70 family, may contain an N-terminal HTH domain [Amycolatopsis regifaucium]
MIGTRPAGQHTVRQHNAALVLGAIADGPGASRAGLSATTGLTKATVSSVVDRLIAADLVAEGEPERRVGPGRRGTVVSLSPTGPHGLGIEIGVDYLASCLVDLTGTVRAEEVRYADNRTPRVFQRVSAFLRKAREQAEVLGVPVGGVGIAVPGVVESAGGLVRLAPNLGWRDVDLADRLGETFTVANEANFAALAELWHGTALPDFVHVSGEIGIGAGIVLDRALFEGVRGAGGEIGHLPVAPDGPPCSCGANGCLERMAGQEEILRLAGAETVDDLISALESGDDAAGAAVTTAAGHLGIGLSTVVNLMDVPAVVLGGTYARLEPWLREPLLAELKRRVPSTAWSPVRVIRSALGTGAAVRGAAGSVIRGILADPEHYLTTHWPSDQDARAR